MLLEEIRDHMYEANHTWITSVRKLLKRSILEGLVESSKRSKAFSFLSHPVPECSCIKREHRVLNVSLVEADLGVTHRCPQGMDGVAKRSKDNNNAEREEDLDEEDLSSSGLFFGHMGSGGSSNSNNETVNSEANNKEEGQLEDQEELEGGER